MTSSHRGLRLSRALALCLSTILNAAYIDHAQAAGNSIYGTVVDAADGNTPVHPVWIWLWDAVENAPVEGSGVGNHPDGSYIMENIPEGSYKVFYDAYGAAAGYTDKLYDNKTCNPCFFDEVGDVLNVSTGQYEANVQMERRLLLSGQVTNEAGSPLAGVAIQVFDSSGVQVHTANLTPEDGYWRQNVPGAGTYYVRTDSSTVPSYQPEVWNNAPCDDCDVLATGTPIVVSNADVPGLDFRLVSADSEETFMPLTADVLFKDGFDIPVPVTDQIFDLQFNLSGLVGSTLMSGANELPVSAGNVNLPIPKDVFSFTHLVDGQENIIGVYFGLPSLDGQPIQINAESTALGMVLSVPLDWSSLAPDMGSYLTLIQTQSGFLPLVTAVDKVQKSANPEQLLDDPNGDIYPALEGLILSLYTPPVAQDKFSEPGLLSQPTARVDALFEYPGPEVEPDPKSVFRVLANNNRSAPFGISSVNLETRDCDATTGWFKTPYWVPGRDWYDSIRLIDETVSYAMSSGENLLCFLKAQREPMPIIEWKLEELSNLGSPELVRPLDLYEAVKSSPLTMEEFIKADARMKADIAQLLTVSISIIGLIPAGPAKPLTEAVSILGPVILEAANTNFGLHEYNVPHAAFAGGEAKVISKALDSIFQDRQSAESFIRFLAKKIYGDARKYASTGSRFQMAAIVIGKLADAGEAADLILISASTLLPKHEECYLVEISPLKPAVINPYGGSLGDAECDKFNVKVEKFDTSLNPLPENSGLVSSQPSGVIDCGNAACEAKFEYGTQITLEGQKFPSYNGWKFTKWADDSDVCNGTDTSTCVFYLDSDKVARAIFDVPKTYQLSVKKVDENNPYGGLIQGGLVVSNPTGIDCGQNGTVCDFDFPEGEQVTLQAWDGDGWQFARWASGPCAGSEATNCAFEVSNDVVVTAEFNEEAFALTSFEVGSWYDVGVEAAGCVANANVLIAKADIDLHFVGALPIEQGFVRVTTKETADGQVTVIRAGGYFEFGATTDVTGSTINFSDLPVCWKYEGSEMELQMNLSSVPSGSGFTNTVKGIVERPTSN